MLRLPSSSSSASSSSSSSSDVDVVAAWVAWLGGRPATTVRARLADLRQLAAFVAERTGGDLLGEQALATQLAEIGSGGARALIAAWTTSQASSGLAGTTIARRISTVASWYAELGEHGLGWAPRLPRPTVASYQQRECPAWSRIDELVAQLQQQGRTRELVALLLLCDVGLREAEACSINADRVTREPLPGVHVRRKGGREVWREISARAAAAIDDVLDGRTRGPVLLSARGRRLSSSGLRFVIEQLLASSPHRMRNAGATELYRRTHNVEWLRQWLDHADLSTSQRYVQLFENFSGAATRLLAGES